MDMPTFYSWLTEAAFVLVATLTFYYTWRTPQRLSRKIGFSIVLLSLTWTIYGHVQ